jgi:hypothetical protein
MRKPLFATTIAASLLAIPSPALAGWSTPEVLTQSGSAFGVSVAADAQGDAGVAYVRTLNGSHRAELRRGTVRGKLAAPVVLNTTAHAMDTTALAFDADRNATTAWRQYVDGNDRVWGAFVDRNGRRGSLLRVTGGGESAYEPAFAVGAGPSALLFWGRRTFAGAAAPENGGYLRYHSLQGPSVDVSMTTTADGAVTAAWTTGGVAYAASLPRPTASWTAPQQLSDPSAGMVASTPVLTVARNGNVLAAWTASNAGGIELDAAVRPAGASSFGPPAQIVDPGDYARRLRLATMPSGELLLTYLATRGHVSSGPVELVRLNASAAILQRLTLTSRGETASASALAADGTSGAFAAWAENGPDRGVLRAVRIAPGGIVGTVKTLSSTGDPEALPALAGLPNGGALLAWSSPTDHRVRLARYSP